jgi:plastocyanin
MTRFVLISGIAAVAAFSSGAAAQDISVTLTEWKLRLSTDTVPAGAVTFEVTNRGTVGHAIQVVGPGVDKGTRQIGAREVATLTVTLKPGSYDIFCPLAEGSHKSAGMSKTLVVIAGATPPAK